MRRGGGGGGIICGYIDIQNSFKLLRIFQLFYSPNGCLPLTNGLLPVPDEETPPGAKKYH